MKNTNDNPLKKLLNAATAKDLGYTLDKDALWNKIQKKNNTRVFPIQLWITHAAAIAAGIFFAALFFTNKNSRKNEPTVVHANVPIIENKTVTDTVLVTQYVPQHTYKNALKKLSKKKINTLTPIEVVQTKEEKTAPNSIIIKEPKQIIAVNNKPSKQFPVLYLVDMDNENSIPKPVEKQGYTLFKKINICANSEDKSETISMLVGRQFFHSKN